MIKYSKQMIKNNDHAHRGCERANTYDENGSGPAAGGGPVGWAAAVVHHLSHCNSSLHQKRKHKTPSPSPSPSLKIEPNTL